MGEIQLSSIEDVNRRKARAEAQRAELAKQVNDIQLELSNINKSIGNYNAQLKVLESKTGKPTITDHAVLRYLERHNGLDVKKIRETLLTDGLKSAIESRVKKYKVDGVEFVIMENKVVTIC